MNARPAIETGSLQRIFLRGVAWGGAAKALGQSVSWLATLVVARYLTPTDYGIFGLAMLYLGLLQLVADLGLSTAVLANRHLSDEDLPQIHGLAALSGIVGTLIVAATAPLVAWLFGAPALRLLLVVLSPIFLVNSLRTIPQALLQRDFRFRWLAFVETGQAVVLAGLTVLLAMAGLGYWTLAAAAMGAAVVNTVVVSWQKPVPLRWPRFHRLRALLHFSMQVVFQRLAWYLSNSADFATASKLLGPGPAGAYALAYQFANTPIDRIATLILQVSPSMLGACAGDRELLRAHVIRATRLIALLVFPLCIGMALVARPFVSIVLGPQWEVAIVPLQILAAYGAVRSLVPLMGQVLLVVGEERYATRLMVLNLVVMVAAFLVGARIAGIVGIAVAYVVAHPIVSSAYCLRALRSIDCSVRRFLVQAVWPALACTMCMIVSLQVATLLLVDVDPRVSLGGQILAGAAGYLLGALLFFRERVIAAFAVMSGRSALGAR